MTTDNRPPLGVNLIAYIRAEMGLGTAARGLAMALETASVPFNIINFEYLNPALHRDESWRHKEGEACLRLFAPATVSRNILERYSVMEIQCLRVRLGELRVWQPYHDHAALG